MASSGLEDLDLDETSTKSSTPPRAREMEKVPPSSFFSSPVIDLTESRSSSDRVDCLRNNIDTAKELLATGVYDNSPSSSTTATLEHPNSSSESEERSIQNDSKTKREYSREIIEILSSSEEDETGEKIAAVSKSTKRRRSRSYVGSYADKATVRKNNKSAACRNSPMVGSRQNPSRKRVNNAPTKRPKREYFHARTNQPYASARELQDDSDCEDVDNWLHTMSESLLNDFDDVSEKEKKFMILWNRFIKCHYVIADRDIPWKVERFVHQHREELKEQDLRMNLLLHLSNLWDFGLVSKSTIIKCMTSYDVETPLGRES